MKIRHKNRVTAVIGIASAETFSSQKEVDVDYIERPKQTIPPQILEHVKKEFKKYHDEYFPRSVTPPENPTENEKIREILQEAFKSTRSKNYSMTERNPDPFVPAIIRGDYYHWRDQDGQDYWRTDLFSKDGLVEQYVQNPDGVFGTVENMTAEMIDTFFLGRPESMALPLSENEWKHGRFTMKEDIFQGNPCYVIEMRLAETIPPKAIYTLVSTGRLSEHQISEYPSIRSYTIDKSTGLIYSYRHINSAGRLLRSAIFTPLSPMPNFSKDFSLLLYVLLIKKLLLTFPCEIW